MSMLDYFLMDNIMEKDNMYGQMVIYIVVVLKKENNRVWVYFKVKS